MNHTERIDYLKKLFDTKLSKERGARMCIQFAVLHILGYTRKQRLAKHARL